MCFYCKQKEVPFQRYKSGLYTSLFRLVQQVRGGEVWRGGALETRSFHADIDAPCKCLPLHFPLALTVHFQRLDDGVLDFLRGRPRRKILADTFLGNLELLYLITLFLLHNGQHDVLVELPGLRKILHFDGLGMRGGAVLGLNKFV